LEDRAAYSLVLCPQDPDNPRTWEEQLLEVLSQFQKTLGANIGYFTKLKYIKLVT